MISARQIRRRLGELTRASDQASAIGLADELRRSLLRCDGVDRILFDDVARAFERFGLRIGSAWTPATLPVGETWLMLVREGTGVIARLRIVSGTSQPRLGGEASWCFERAYEGLATALLGISCGPPEHGGGRTLAIESEHSELDFIDGPSLGLSACVALVSAWTNRAPDTGVAGTAEVRPDGRLVRVGAAGLGAKLAALARAWPGVVGTVVVATGQEVGAVPDGIAIERCDDVLGALTRFGLEPSNLPLEQHDRIERRLTQLAHDNDRALGREGWLDLARQAWTVAEALRHDDLSHARALSWAMLFALHGGDTRTAFRYQQEIADSAVADMQPDGRVWYRIISASNAIDRGQLDAAEATAREAVREARGLSSRESQREVLGRSLGTLGRVLVHDERYAEATGLLREAADFHARALPHEEPRSLVQLATCLRLAGAAAEALAIAELGVDRLARHRREQAALTMRFLDLEIGRCLFELGEPARARQAFERAAEGQPHDADNPRTSALRGRARACRRLDQRDEADGALRRCLAVAADPEITDTTRQVAALAAGEALLDLASGHSCAVPAAELRRVWDRHHAGGHDLDAISRRIRRVVY